MMYDANGNPLAIPTPYVSPQNGGNPNIIPGSQTQPVPAVATPIQSLATGGIKFDTGVTVPSANVYGAGSQTVPRTTQNWNLGANNTKLTIPTPAPTPSPNNGFNWSSYQQRGWTNYNAALADYNKGGGRWNDTGSDPSGDVARREAETRNSIESGYGDYVNGLMGMQTGLQNNQQSSLDSASRTYEQIFGGLKDQKQISDQKLEAGRQEVNSRKANSVKDLQSNLSNVLRGASMQFGAMGAGDTSATRVMLPYAYTKMAGVQEGDIQKQANQQQFEIDQQSRDTESKFSEMWRQTEVDKETQLQSIRDYFGTAIQNVQSAMARVPLDKANSLASLSQSLLSEAMSNLRQLEAEDRQNKENIKTWATNRMSELNNMKLSLANSASFNPRDIARDELGIQGVNPNQYSNGMDYSSYVTAARKKYLGQ